MRLTLRTMLAYLDDILEPVDAQELGQKIEDSKFASDLVHRIRVSTRRLRLAAPPVEGEGMGSDPNSVAEYLDNTLPPEQVPEFEKVCLESDVHLAEVASCHQILTLVLGEPADVDDAVRGRVYGIGQMASTSAAMAAVAGNGDGSGDLAAMDVLDDVPPAAAAPAAHTSAARRGLPVGSLLVTVALAFLLAIVGLRAMGEFNRDHPVLRLFPAGEPVAQVEPREDVRPTDESPDERLVTPPPLVVPPPGTTPPDEPVAPSATGQDELLDAEAAIADEPEPPPAAPVIGEGPSEPAPAAPSDPPPSATRPAEATDGSAAEQSPSIAVEGGVTASPPPPPSGAVEADASVGRFISENQVLARLQADDEAWFRLETDVPLEMGDRLVSFPTYRPQILLQSGIKLTLAGPSELWAEQAEQDGSGRIRLQHGRLLLVPVTDSATRLTVDLQDRVATIQLPGMRASAALDVRRYLPPGADPASDPPQVVVRLYSTGGQVEWQSADGEPQIVKPGQMLTVIGTNKPTLHESVAMPEWIDGREMRAIDRRASLELQDYLAADRPLSLALLEQTEFERQYRVEVRALACRCLVQLDIYDPALEALADQRVRAYWPDLFLTLRRELTRGPEAAARLEALLARLYGDSSGRVYRILRGYSPEQLAEGGAEELVNDLENVDQRVRVLAYLELERITGMTHLFLPWQPPAQERVKLAKWRQSLKDGRVVYKQQPTPLPELAAGGVGDSESAPAGEEGAEDSETDAEPSEGSSGGR